MFWRRMVDALRGPALKRGSRAAARGRWAVATAAWLDGAQQGCSGCQLALAEALSNGTGVLRDLGNAIRWYKAAADQGEVLAQARLAGFYANGVGREADWKAAANGHRKVDFFLPRDDRTAIGWALKAAEQGHTESQVLLAWLLSRDRAGADDDDIKQAVHWYSSAADLGSAPAMVGLAGLISSGMVPGKDDADAFKLYQQAAELGNLTATYFVGALLLRGIGVEADLETARQWLIKAAEGGIIAAMRGLGLIHLRGMGVSIDIWQAETWFRRAANKGDVESMVLLADLHANGQAAVPNKAESIIWYALAAEKEHAGACLAMGQACLDGGSVPSDPERAFAYFEMAAVSLVEARFRLGLCYLQGTGTAADPALAYQWLCDAADQGHADATYNVGAMLYNGVGVPADREEALRLYQKAADMGSASGLFRIAYAHTAGVELPEDPDRAIDLFTRAAELGHVVARINLIRMLLKHRPDDRTTLENERSKLKPAAEGGLSAAIAMLAELAWRLDRDADGAIALARRALAMGDPQAERILRMAEEARSSV